MDNSLLYPTSLNCLYCETVFIVHNKHQLNRKFCSLSCNTSNNNKNRVWKQVSKDKVGFANKGKLSGSNNPNFQGGGKICSCKNCKKEFRIGNHNAKNEKHSGQYCSKDCYFDIKRTKKLSVDQKRLSKLFSRNLSLLIKKRKKETASKWFKVIGYTLEQLITHIENQFLPGMNWDNYGKSGWHIDHIKPISYFKFDCPDQLDFKECWALNNLQPLWEKDNLRKGGSNTKINKLKYG